MALQTVLEPSMGKTHIVQQGECLGMIAMQHGFFHCKDIYDHSRNRELMRKRPEPNLLHPGDEVYIPDLELKWVDCESGRRHTFVRHSPRKRLEVILLDSSDKPIAGMPYELQLEKEFLRRTTNKDGLVSEEVPMDVLQAKLIVSMVDHSGEQTKATYDLEIGYLDPLEEVSGLQARLNNLGFDCGAVDGEAGSVTQEAIAEFRKRAGLGSSLDLDSETLRWLFDVYGC